MTKYPDGSILILPDEKKGIDDLIDKHLGVGVYTYGKLYISAYYKPEEIERFVQKWKELNKDNK